MAQKQRVFSMKVFRIAHGISRDYKSHRFDCLSARVNLSCFKCGNFTYTQTSEPSPNKSHLISFTMNRLIRFMFSSSVNAFYSYVVSEVNMRYSKYVLSNCCFQEIHSSHIEWNKICERKYFFRYPATVEKYIKVLVLSSWYLFHFTELCWHTYLIENIKREWRIWVNLSAHIAYPKRMYIWNTILLQPVRNGIHYLFPTCSIKTLQTSAIYYYIWNVYQNKKKNPTSQHRWMEQSKVKK